MIFPQILQTFYTNNHIRAVMRLADERMYKDKEEFYKKHPEFAQ